MRTDEERIAAMHARATELNKQYRARKVRVMQCIGAAVSVAATIMLAVFMPKITEYNADPVSGSSASVLNNSGDLGYVVIAIIAFLLGVAGTMFCYRLREWKERKDNEEI